MKKARARQGRATEIVLTDAAKGELSRYVEDVRAGVLAHVDSPRGVTEYRVGREEIVRAIRRSEQQRNSSKLTRSRRDIVFLVASVVGGLGLGVIVNFLPSLITSPDALAAYAAIAGAVLAAVAMLFSALLAARQRGKAEDDARRAHFESAMLVQQVALVESLARRIVQPDKEMSGRQIPLRRLLDHLVDEGVWSDDDVRRFAETLAVRNAIVHDAIPNFSVTDLLAARLRAADLVSRLEDKAGL
ncbi:hypothetical protein SAMN05216553_10412 [Lentzea fradiae]|uniref:Uncharacterized protein n=1 Tax=Lentzea fradiae TaxID=200378 RepID=A0A1G7PQ83_9PSEU|nr:hypothetical protein [Lentzea fradiae]SDF88418.1 hypothetical protein SAMN05216553_10412 [Lentzea fradiae]